MCTVTYIPTKSGFFLTSSRDEKLSRPTALPEKHILNGQVLFHPKDERAGGTWISINNNGRAGCLLNGAFKNHKKVDHYAKSRGLVLIDSFNYKSILEFVREVDLNNIEPFTLLLLDFPFGSLTEFYELKWDGENKHVKKLNLYLPQIWSSPTLYSMRVRKNRKLLFERWLNSFTESKDKMIFNFHNRRHGLKMSEDILMQGEGDLKTVSISQIHTEMGQVYFNYLDMIQNKSISENILNEVKFYA